MSPADLPLDRPLLLGAANVTPPSRTPWGGRRIAALKAPFAKLEGPVGESWEVSFGPELPSPIEGVHFDLAALASVRAVELCGREAASGGSALLVKLIDTAEPLSVQIHPADGDPRLGATESGKPECWLVTHAEPGAAIWLGLAEGTNERTMRDALARGGDVGAQLARHEVTVGDFFVLPPGTPHAIGAGLSIVEPQLVRAGRRGITYRYFDWHRRYDAAGRADPRGVPRALHVEEALGVTRWDTPRGDRALDATRMRAGSIAPEAPMRATWLAGRGGLPFPLDVARVGGTGELPLFERDVACGVTVIAGALTLVGPWGRTRIEAGRSALLPAAMKSGTLEGEAVHALFASVG